MKKSMKMIMAVLLTGGIASGLLAQEAENKTFTGKVQANKLNIRVKPGQKYTSVGSYQTGDQVNIIKSQGSWYEIALPDNAAVWVAADSVADGKITKTASLRSGPGVEHQSYMQAKAGQEVKVIDSSRKLWVKIAPLPGMTAWVSKEYITVSNADYAKIPGNQVASSEDDGKKPGKTDDTPKSTAKRELPYVAGSAKKVSVSGVLQPVAPGETEITHALCASFTDTTAKYYLIGKKARMGNFEGKEVTLTGTRYFVSGDWKVPVIEVESVKAK